jgi:hypothetical protein
VGADQEAGQPCPNAVVGNLALNSLAPTG